MITLPHRNPDNFEVRRLCDFLHHIDAGLTNPCELHLFGSSAVNFYQADAADGLRQTNDIDVTGESTILSNHGEQQDELEHLAKTFEDPTLDPKQKLHFQFVSVGMFFAGVDWRENLVSAKNWFGHDKLHIKLLHPIDLIISKMERYLRRDIDDGEDLYQRYVVSIDATEIFDRYFYQAIPFAMNERVTQNVAYAYEDITDRDFDESLIDDDPSNI